MEWPVKAVNATMRIVEQATDYMILLANSPERPPWPHKRGAAALFARHV